jgi:ATP-dependent exoDNAse (exonuclease V) alpha subunit
MKEGFESAGYRVIAAALSGVAKEELASKTGIATRTLASLLFHLEKSAAERFGDRFDHVRNQIGRAAAGQSTWRRDEVRLDAKTVLFIDEASMVDNRTMARVFRLAEKSGATVVLIKDDKQLQPVEAGMPTRTIDGTVPQAHLSTNRRQQDPQDREAVQNLRDGRAVEAVKSYADRGLVTVADNRREAIEKLVSTWVADGGARRPEKIAVFVPTRAEAAEVNRLCQEARLEAVRTPHVAFVRNGEERYYRDDRVMFHKPHRLHGGIENGFRGTVVSVDPVRSEIKVRLDKPPRQLEGRAPRSQTVTIPVREFGSDVSLGYASTAHKGQSQTVPAAMILVGGRNTDRELAYVEVTRASGATKWFVDRSHVGEQWKDLIAAVEKSRPKTMAHDHARSESERPEIERQLARG